MSKGLRFTPDEEKEFAEMIRFHPKSFSERMGVRADRVANNIWMFFALLVFSLISWFFLRSILDQMLFISNTYQLIVLPVLGIATGLSMTIILRFLFRIYLEQRKTAKETHALMKDVHELVREIHHKTKEGNCIGL